MFYEKERKINILEKRVKELEAEIESMGSTKVVDNDKERKPVFKLVWRRESLKKHVLVLECSKGDSMDICDITDYNGELEFFMSNGFRIIRDGLIKCIEKIKKVEKMKDIILLFLSDRLLYDGCGKYDNLESGKVYLWCSEPSENGGYGVTVGEAK
jgi:hypothetical protein